MDGGSEEWGSFLSKMNIMDGIGRRMELQRERKEHSSMLCFLRLYCRCDERAKHGN